MKKTIAVGFLLFVFLTLSWAVCPTSITCGLDGQSMYFTGRIRTDSYGHLEGFYEHLAPGGKHVLWIICD